MIGGRRTLEADSERGTAGARTGFYGFAGGVGLARANWSIGPFAGYFNDRQTLPGLGARTSVDGGVFGLHGRLRSGAAGVKATIAYDDGRARTRRATPGGTADGHYDLRGWTADVTVDYLVPLGSRWTVRPSVGATMVRVTRGATVESGGGAFALAVARDRRDALFVDGGLTFAKAADPAGAVVGQLRPYLALGVRYQAHGRDARAVGALGGGGFGLIASGAERAPLLATSTLGANVALTPRLTAFGVITGESGDAGNRASGQLGLRLIF